jgi:hypothetical protein
MQTSTSPIQITAQISRTDRPAGAPLSQLIAKALKVPAPVATAPEPQPATATEQRLVRPDGRNVRLGSLIDIRV